MIIAPNLTIPHKRCDSHLSIVLILSGFEFGFFHQGATTFPHPTDIDFYQQVEVCSTVKSDAGSYVGVEEREYISAWADRALCDPVQCNFTYISNLTHLWDQNPEVRQGVKERKYAFFLLEPILETSSPWLMLFGVDSDNSTEERWLSAQQYASISN